MLGHGHPIFRITRALRPLFLLDTILLQDVRRLFLYKVHRYIIYTFMYLRIYTRFACTQQQNKFHHRTIAVYTNQCFRQVSVLKDAQAAFTVACF